MNTNRLLQMALRPIMRKGIDWLARRGKQPDDMTPQEREQAGNARQLAQKAQRGMRAARRFMK